ncbi:MAG: AI-2E family transporter [Gammaproteobacteria bacterium]|nr:AI-2E family transporter [Gammaproteobacteria bacterium]
MQSTSPSIRSQSILLNVAAFVIIIAGMRAAEAILVPFLLSAFIAIIAAPPMFWLQRHKIPAALAILIIIGVIFSLMVLLATFIGTSVNDFSSALPDYEVRIQSKTAGLIDWLNGLGLSISKQEILQYFDPGQAMQLASKIFRGLGSVLSNTLLIILTVIFILAEASSFPLKLQTILGENNSLGGFQAFLDNMQTYVGIKTLTSLATGLIVSIFLAIIGVDYWLLWGLLAFLLNFIPTIGSIIAAIPAVLLALVQLGPGAAALTAAVYILINTIIGNFVEPRFMGKGLGLSTLVVFLSLLFWGWVLGPVGMLLSVPLTMTAKIALDSYDDTRWLAILLGPESAIRTETSSQEET